VEKLRLAVLREIPEDEKLRRAWDALVEQADQPQVFFTYEWALAVQRAYGATLRPLIFLAYEEGEVLCGVAALAMDPSNKTASFLCATTGDYCDFLSSTGDREVFAADVLAELSRLNVTEIKLANLPADSATVPALRYASSLRRYHLFSRTAYVCAQVSLGALERRAENKPVLPRKKMLRRFLNAMGREAPVCLDHARCWEQAETVLPGFIEAHIARFLVTGRISNLVSKQRRLFLEELAKLLSKRGWFALTTFSAGRQVFAWNYGFHFLGTWFWYQPTFDSDFEKHSPGFCLLAKLIEETADKPELKTVDLGLGAEEYKDRFANQTRETLYVTLHSSPLRHIGEFTRYHVASAVKKQPTAERGLRATLTRISTVRQRFRRSGFEETCRWVARRVWDALGARDEVFFYELTDPAPALLAVGGVCLKPLDLKVLAAAAVQNANDEGTLAYLLRCAKHLRTDGWSGFALVSHGGDFLHFTWAGPFDSFHWSELNSTLESPAPDSVVLFDSWTPISQRGKGYYAPMIAMVARKAATEGKRCWGFSASTNSSSVRGLEKAGFERSFSIIRYRVLWWQRVVQQQCCTRKARIFSN
jgi:CelD/BcsL family acetyltransferase involved in cellulose biosynthesis